MFPDLTRDDVFRIETRRLWLRWPTARDAEAVSRFAGDPAVAEMTARISSPLPLPEAESFVIQARAMNTAGEGLIMALCRRAAPANLIGVVSVENRPDASEPHLGYWLGRPFWGEGLMTEAAEALVDATFAYAGERALASSAMIGNPGSRRVLEKCGFRLTGESAPVFEARGGAVPSHNFRLDRAEWLDRRGTAAGGRLA
ncbi:MULTISPECIES: GNAT family N-acetyltransferase [Methylorubrum]|jgi:RimJ/RimL family protein N-acetyltransferase|uniref:GCN5-related N-acetyltransferase n=2 Tax=Methylorubrum extorquens TaxID=408 RepID=H1KNJ7_METEX|nr:MULTISPECIES: GNAT family N-acetyltransferase [Methylorubrum]ACS42463.1 putative acetyltransferase, putative N-acetylase of ribosomal proteins [Methylorubrum extorquens AM1]EHP90900.1 GCN5-related N-acetyltransferase [Methylorubrum extorquens DSM 13060]MCP1544469.1 RimJ/RimL family protein N-acetyltransferase [Methylorubrum extorquens]MCP1588186.1 RimJ/RimL family protein N-acetyltransferase [Methylorubrum extorquens]BDL41937.1 N-acetyltransferase GCN5 [Methylorubrum sp. GM97]